jgi:hypothetical protein
MTAAEVRWRHGTYGGGAALQADDDDGTTSLRARGGAFTPPVNNNGSGIWYHGRGLLKINYFFDDNSRMEPLFQFSFTTFLLRQQSKTSVD